MHESDDFSEGIYFENMYLGKCWATVHALSRFKKYACSSNVRLYNKDNDYFKEQFKKVFYIAKDGKIKKYHNVIRLMNNNYQVSHYLFNHSANFRFVVVEKNKNIVTCEIIYK